MRVTAVQLRDFRSIGRAEVRLGPGLNVVYGPNGAGKTNLLEAIYVGCTGRSCRTASDQQQVRFGAPAARVELRCEDAGDRHELSVAIAPPEPKRLHADGLRVERFTASTARPLVGVFLPDRLQLVTGPPALRRGHIDQVVAALWPARAPARSSYARALAQRNALLARSRGGAIAPAGLEAWDAELAAHAVEVMAARSQACALLREPFAERAAALGLAGGAELLYRPRSSARSAAELVEELRERRAGDLARGLTLHGPHRDELVLLHSSRPLRSYGSQGERRTALLALLLADREVLRTELDRPPLMLVDDVMSELDGARRERLVAELRAAGQSVVTTTELGHVPGADAPDVTRIRVEGGAVLQEAVAA